MIDWTLLVNTMADKFLSMPPLLALLAPENPVVAYLDLPPDEKSIMKARYQMQPGSVLISWRDTVFLEGQVTGWSHQVEIDVKAWRNVSTLAMVRELVNGIPVPGDGQVWRMCPVISGVYNTIVSEIHRETDPEGVDFFVLITKTLETGDYL
jgi:hypothetical protein